MSEQPTNFDDPGLKLAIRRLRGGHHARPELRDRIAKLLAETRADSGESTRDFRRFTPGRIAALAAALALVISGVVIYSMFAPAQPQAIHLRPSGPPRPPSTAGDYTVNDKLLSAMVQRHAGHGSNADERAMTTPLSDPPGLAMEASQKLGQTVPTIHLPGWKMDSASLCTLNSVQGARFHLTRGDQGISVVCVPKSAYGSNAMGKYEKIVDGYPIAGTVVGNSLDCVVGDKSSDLKQVAALRDQILGP